MSYALAQLAALLQAPTATPGQVLSVGSAGVRIATPGGAVLASAAPGTSLRPGDRVSIQNGIARKTPPSTHTYAL